jgi:hypothetical protein
MIHCTGGNGSMIMLNDTDFFVDDKLHELTVQQPSLPLLLHPKDIDNTSDDDEKSTLDKENNSSMKLADSS